MVKKEYGAGMVKLSFWFLEFRRMIALLNAGVSFETIKVMSERDNIFLASTKARAAQIFNTVSARVKSCDAALYPFFEASDVRTQKIIALIAVMNTDRLFFDFMAEVVGEKFLMGENMLSDSDVRIFFRDKQVQSEKVASFTEGTLKRLGSTYKTMLTEAGLLAKASGDRPLLKPILDIELEKHLRAQGLLVFIRILTGVR